MHNLTYNFIDFILKILLIKLLLESHIYIGNIVSLLFEKVSSPLDIHGQDISLIKSYITSLRAMQVCQ